MKNAGGKKEQRGNVSNQESRVLLLVCFAASKAQLKARCAQALKKY
jgi:hypothetical protein